MTLDEFEAIWNAGTPKPWGTIDLANCVWAGFNNNALGEPSTFEDARAIAAASVMVPKMIKALKAAENMSVYLTNHHPHAASFWRAYDDLEKSK